MSQIVWLTALSSIERRCQYSQPQNSPHMPAARTRIGLPLAMCTAV